MDINTEFDFYSDSRGGDPDRYSPTLRAYHQFLWSKPLPDGRMLKLEFDSRNYLKAVIDGEVRYLGSDAITHSYRDHKRKKALIDEVRDEAEELFKKGSTIGAYALFPNKQVNRAHTINQSRGVRSMIDDRFDLTLECIRRHYLELPSPLDDVFSRYDWFFALFGRFEGYVSFFLLQDLVDAQGQIKFYLPFDDFQTHPTFRGVDDYLRYKSGVMEFIDSRNARIGSVASVMAD